MNVIKMFVYFFLGITLVSAIVPLSKAIAFYHLEQILAVKSLDIDLQFLSFLLSRPQR